LVVCQIPCAKLIGATSSEGWASSGKAWRARRYARKSGVGEETCQNNNTEKLVLNALTYTTHIFIGWIFFGWPVCVLLGLVKVGSPDSLNHTNHCSYVTYHIS